MKVLIVFLAIALTGCASDKGITDFRQYNSDSKSILILKDAPTRETVLPVLTQWFSDNGFSATVIESLNEVDPELHVFSYRAKWSWDLATYMRDVEMKVKSKGETLGLLRFDALQYGGFGKFGNAEVRLKILLDALFGKITREEADIRLGDA